MFLRRDLRQWVDYYAHISLDKTRSCWPAQPLPLSVQVVEVTLPLWHIDAVAGGGVHPIAGERKLAPVKAMKAVAAACQEASNTMVEAADEAMRVNTPGGVFSVRWDARGSATALGQLAFFAEYLEATGLFERWLQNCPLSYTSPNAPALVDVLGTWMLSILDGHCRYAHVGALRGDGVAPSILGMHKIIGDDSLRRALSAIAPAPEAQHTELQRAAQQAQLARSTQWMQDQLRHSIAQATTTAWILDCDTTIKVLYGKQDGAVVSYNPHKPGRPSHAIHTYWIGNLRLVLDAQLEPGNRHSPVHARPGLLALLEGMPQEQRPKLVRGDCAYGSEGEMSALDCNCRPGSCRRHQAHGRFSRHRCLPPPASDREIPAGLLEPSGRDLEEVARRFRVAAQMHSNRRILHFVGKSRRSKRNDRVRDEISIPERRGGGVPGCG